MGDSERSFGILTNLIGVPRRIACDRIAYTTRRIINVILPDGFECFGKARRSRRPRPMLPVDVEVAVETEAAKVERILKQ